MLKAQIIVGNSKSSRKFQLQLETLITVGNLNCN